MRTEAQIQAARASRPAPREVQCPEYLGPAGVVAHMAALRTRLALASARIQVLESELRASHGREENARNQGADGDVSARGDAEQAGGAQKQADGVARAAAEEEAQESELTKEPR